MDVSVVIVNYNTKLLTVACIASVVENTRDVDYEIILVDNDSSDGTVDEVRKKYPDVIISQMDENVGFGRANNAGAELAKGKYLFLLNSDTVLIENSIKEFFDFMENNPKYSACGCNLIDSIIGYFSIVVVCRFVSPFYHFHPRVAVFYQAQSHSLPNGIA